MVICTLQLRLITKKWFLVNALVPVTNTLHRFSSTCTSQVYLQELLTNGTMTSSQDSLTSLKLLTMEEILINSESRWKSGVPTHKNIETSLLLSTQSKTCKLETNLTNRMSCTTTEICQLVSQSLLTEAWTLHNLNQPLENLNWKPLVTYSLKLSRVLLLLSSLSSGFVSVRHSPFASTLSIGSDLIKLYA